MNLASELSDAALTAAQAVERDAILKRAYIALNQAQLALSAPVSDPGALALRAADALAQHAGAQEQQEREEAYSRACALLDELVEPSDNALATTLLATLLSRCEGERERAMRLCGQANSLETSALLVQLLIMHNRQDVAETQAQAMQAVDDDNPLTQLALVWTSVAKGGQKALEEASTIVTELSEKFGRTAKLASLSALCKLAAAHVQDAESDLSDGLAEFSQDPDLLALLVIANVHLNKPYQRFFNQLRSLQPCHPVVHRFDSLTDAFDRVTATLGE